MMHIVFALMLAADQSPTVDMLESLAFDIEMHERFTRATLIQTALINGDLETARHWGEQLAAMAPEDSGFADLPSRFGALARNVADAGTIPDAAVATARLADACGACHELHGVANRRFESNLPAPPGDTLEKRMARHIWAADRLWEGLVGRAEMPWQEAAEVLVEAPFDTAGLEAPNAQQAREMAQRVRDLGAEALDNAQWQARAHVYGRFLATCAACHDIYRGD